MRLYLDACCLNRPFDAQTQERVRAESNAVKFALDRIATGIDVWVTSTAVEMELKDCGDLVRRRALLVLLELASECLQIDADVVARAELIEKRRILGLDAIHLSAAVLAKCEVFLTTDDRLARRARRAATFIPVRVLNPIEWMLEVTAE